MNSPQLLLLSGVGSEKHLRQHGIKVIHDLPGVGKNFHNHVSYGIKFAINNLNHDKVDEISPLQQYLSQQNGPMSATGLGQVTAILASNYTTKDDPDIQLFFSGYLAGCKSKDTRKTRYLEIIPVNLHAKSRGKSCRIAKQKFFYLRICFFRRTKVRKRRSTCSSVHPEQRPEAPGRRQSSNPRNSCSFKIGPSSGYEEV